MKLQNYILGRWISGKGSGQDLFHAVTGQVIAKASTEGIDFKEVLHYGRSVGNNNLRNMTFHERGRMIKSLALYLNERKDIFYQMSWATGATRRDAWVDIEGGIGNLFSYSSLRRQFPDTPFCVDGESIPMSKEGTFSATHIMTPKMGVALHINAYNFPIWGMLEKIAVNLLAGMPAVVKPATVTSYLTALMVRSIDESGILPPGALQLIVGSANGIISDVEWQDVVTFTGSATTGRRLKGDPNIIENSIPFNLEADSLNAAVLGEDAQPGSPEYDIFIKEVSNEITTKAGQKCTAVRRIIVPSALVGDVEKSIAERLRNTLIGDPQVKNVKMGSLAGMTQRDEVIEKIQLLQDEQQIVYGDIDSVSLQGANAKSGAFISPILMYNDRPFEKTAVHHIEAFGPVSTILPYDNIDQAIDLTRLGLGSLVTSLTTANDQIATDFVMGTAPYNGRILINNRDSAKESTGHGSPMPLLVHGGPGRAGGGEEMGGKRGVYHYMQRTALQGSPTTLSAITQVYQPGGAHLPSPIHLFKKSFECLRIGETIKTHKRTVTETDIVNFANVSWDHFYAHTDITSLEGTIFEHRVAHGYFILAAAAGLFVDPGKGSVLLNYGVESCRFTKPVYAGSTIGVNLTVKEKIRQEQKEDEDYCTGIVKFLVEVYDQTQETVAVATILTVIRT